MPTTEPTRILVVSDRTALSPELLGAIGARAERGPVCGGSGSDDPRGIDDAHGYGKPSRFVTEEVRATCDQIRSDDERTAFARPSHPPRKISVSVDALFQ